jgi:hypothetical protein
MHVLTTFLGLVLSAILINQATLLVDQNTMLTIVAVLIAGYSLVVSHDNGAKIVQVVKNENAQFLRELRSTLVNTCPEPEDVEDTPQMLEDHDTPTQLRENSDDESPVSASPASIIEDRDDDDVEDGVDDTPNSKCQCGKWCHTPHKSPKRQ